MIILPRYSVVIVIIRNKSVGILIQEVLEGIQVSCQSRTAKTSLDLLPRPCQCQSEWTSRQNGKNSRHYLHLVCSSAGQRCLETWGTFWKWTGQSISASIAWRKEEWWREVADIPPSEIGNDLHSLRETLALFQKQLLGDFWEERRSAHESFRSLRYHHEQKLETGLL